MNVKYLLLIAICILLTISTVNAKENITSDNLTDTHQDINITFDEQMWRENLTDISVDLPDDSEGDFCVKINDEVIYNQTISEKSFKIPVKLPKKNPEYYINIYPPLDCRPYKVTAFYNNMDLNINKTMKVMYQSPNYNLIHFPEEILKDDPYLQLLMFPRSANGVVEIYIDDELFNKTKARPFIQLDKLNLNLGNHTLKVIYYNDTYYKDFTKTFKFNVTRAVITIPKVVNITHDDCISIHTLDKVTGTVKVYLDSKLIKTEKHEDGYYVLSLADYLKVNSREVTVTLTTKDFTCSKTQLINISYDFDIFAYPLIYGEENMIEIDLPDHLNNKLLTITINGTKYSFKRQTYVMNNAIEVDVSKLPAGNYSMFISYPGDSMFKPHNKHMISQSTIK